MAVLQSDITNAIAELSKLDDDELKKLLNSESNELYDEWIDRSERVKRLEAEREMLMASVKSLAEFNLSRQNDYESDRSKLLTYVSEANRLKEEIHQKEPILMKLANKTSLESTLSSLLAATAQAEEQSELIAKEFLDNSINFETFISKYPDMRKLAHARRIKAERLRQETNESWTVVVPRCDQ